MTALDYRNFWMVPVADVPGKTGAADVMDCADIREVLDGLHVSLADKSVLDIGCGTGRLAQLCGAWTGVDVSPAMVAYCLEHGLAAAVIDAPVDLLTTYATPWAGPAFDVAVALSVFTHIDAFTRDAYLASMRRVAAEIVVDVLPGDEGGTIAAWYTDPVEFAGQLGGHDFEVVSTYRRTSSDGHVHVYFHCR